MGKTEFTASAYVRVTVEVMGLGPYGPDWTSEKIHEQTEQQALEEVRRLIYEDQKGARLRIVGEPEVVIVSQRKVKP